MGSRVETRRALELWVSLKAKFETGFSLHRLEGRNQALLSYGWVNWIQLGKLSRRVAIGPEFPLRPPQQLQPLLNLSPA
jgi:hypothetical protein